MGLIKDELGLEVEETVLHMFQDPKFQQTEALLDYRDRRKAKEREQHEREQQEREEEEQNKQKLFGLF